MNTALTPDDFDYDLPEDRIAMFPAERRDEARLLHFTGGQIIDRRFGEVPAILPEGSQIVVNNTRVIHARIIARKPTGGSIELFLLRPGDDSLETAMAATTKCQWVCLVGGAKRWKSKAVSVHDTKLNLEARLIEKLQDGYLIEFAWTPVETPFGEVVEQLGRIPLPPYIARDAEANDRLRYQTRFAERPGSVAAPTAGLHFTDALLEQMNAKLVKLTLHVSAGTFKPMATGSISDHAMHEEHCEVSREAVRHLAEPVKRYAVGTTSLRTLESIFWLAEKWKNTGIRPIAIDQYEPYSLVSEFGTYSDAMTWLGRALDEEGRDRLGFTTSIMIAPGYKVKSVNGLFTNFHMPKSTLLLLVSALIGDDWRRVYDHALRNDYRFLSYGDGSLLEV